MVGTAGPGFGSVQRMGVQWAGANGLGGAREGGVCWERCAAFFFFFFFLSLLFLLALAEETFFPFLPSGLPTLLPFSPIWGDCGVALAGPNLRNAEPFCLLGGGGSVPEDQQVFLPPALLHGLPLPLPGDWGASCQPMCFFPFSGHLLYFENFFLFYPGFVLCK